MICALLIFQTVGLPKPLADLSPWVDLLAPSRAELRALYESHWKRVRELADPELVAWLHRSPAGAGGGPA